MAYDSRRGVMVLFGGMDGAGFALGDTWEWNGTAWNQVATNGPMRRYHANIAYDSVRGVTVLHGGSGLLDTWEWNGVAWTQRSTSGPPPAAPAAMVFDVARGLTVLYPSGSGETWVWNGVRWRELASSGQPGERSGQSMVYDAALGVCFMMNGAGAGGYLADAWLLNRVCGSADFDRDGDIGTDQDIETFFACLAGNCCPTCPPNADFNGDRDVGTDQDIESFFRVLAGGNC